MPKESEHKSGSEQDNLVIVGIGASAGGLEALRALIPTLPIQKNITFVIAQHMDPKYNSMLGAILAWDIDIPIKEIKHGQRLKPSVLYIVPSGMDAQMQGLNIYLHKATRIGPKPSIDRFFVSLAEECGDRSVGIILSGTGSDGTHGISVIKAQGGITIVQDEDTAKFSSMPHSTIATGHVDLVLAPEQIGGQLADLLRCSGASPTRGYLTRILHLVMEHAGGDFRDYKASMLNRRIERRMAICKVYDIQDYIQLLEDSPKECVELHQDILISVTTFFRDKPAFFALSKQLKYIVDDGGDTIRIWVAGCATGQEAYTIAILLAEYLGQHLHRYHIQIFATDLDEDALLTARQGVYPKVVIDDLDPLLVDKYFQRHHDAWQLSPTIRDMVMFAKHSLVKDPPFSHVDLISCRNVLIYFNENLQQRMFQTFHYALKDNGVLFLGKSESTAVGERLFIPLVQRERLYMKSNEVKAQLPDIIPMGNGKLAYFKAGLPSKTKSILPATLLDNMLVGVDAIDCVLLNAQFDITYIRGNVTAFISFREGAVGLNICDLIHDELRHELRALLYKAKREEGIVRGRKFQMRIKDQPTTVRMLARYLENKEESEKTILVFEHQCIDQDHLEIVSNSNPNSMMPVDSWRVKAIEEELRETRESLQTTIEELETSNEELQATYEEAQSSNEELQTSAEKLQRSNEELQLKNEELSGVNQEVAVKNAEIEASNESLKKEIEERRRAESLVVEQERKLRVIINSEPAWVNICDSQGVILEVNPAGVAIMEADSTEDLLGKKLLDLMVNENKNKLKACRKLLAVGETHKHAVAVKTLKGNMRWLEISTVRLPDEINNNIQIMSIICDQTQFKEAHDKVLQGQTELAHVMRLNTLGAMASGLAHELNQPLSAIGNYLSGCERRVRDNKCHQEEVLDVLQLTNIQVQRAGEIINQVKHFIKQDASLDTATININAAIESAVELARGTGQCNHAKIDLNLTEPLAPVLANKVQIEQVIINLVLNGVEAMDEAGITHPVLFIRTQLVGEEQVEVLIEDSGEGLSAEAKVEIFKPFHTTKAHGMGMGLCVSRSIIELYTGHLSVMDRVGGGTIFRFSLPIYKD